jgi:uncharacterized membrane protein
MDSVVAAAALFVGIHVVVSGTRLRQVIVRRTGENVFRGLFSILSIGALTWLCLAYAAAPLVALWEPPGVVRSAAPLLVLIAVLLAVLGITTPSPTATGGEGLLESTEPARGVLRITRHPFLSGVAIWAATHLAVTGDAAGAVLFGALLLLAVVGPRSIDHKRAARFGPAWARFAAVTSIVPFAAIVRGGGRFVPAELGWWRVALGLAIYGLVLVSHRSLFGVSPLP